MALFQLLLFFGELSLQFVHSILLVFGGEAQFICLSQQPQAVLLLGLEAETVCFHQHVFGVFLCCCLSLFDALNFILNGLSFLLSCCTLPALSLFIQMPIISSPCSSSRHQEWPVDLHFLKSSNRMDVIKHSPPFFQGQLAEMVCCYFFVVRKSPLNCGLSMRQQQRFLINLMSPPKIWSWSVQQSTSWPKESLLLVWHCRYWSCLLNLKWMVLAELIVGLTADVHPSQNYHLSENQPHCIDCHCHVVLHFLCVLPFPCVVSTQPHPLMWCSTGNHKRHNMQNTCHQLVLIQSLNRLSCSHRSWNVHFPITIRHPDPSNIVFKQSLPLIILSLRWKLSQEQNAPFRPREVIKSRSQLTLSVIMR